MAYLMKRGTNGDLAIRFNNRKKFLKEVIKPIDEAESSGSYVTVAIETEPERDYEQEYKKIYRKKSIKDKGADLKKEIGLLKALMGWG